MTRRIVKAILDQAMTDDQFRDLLLADPDKALAEYHLTPVEIEAIKEAELAEVRMRLLSSKPGPEGARLQGVRSLDINALDPA